MRGPLQRRPEAGSYRDRLRADPSFFLELQYCDEHGLPHSFFLGGAHRWTPVDRAKALAYLLEKAEICALCGTAEWVWKENRRAYTPVEHHCPGCYMKSSLEQEAGDTPGTTIRLVPSGTTEDAQRLIQQRADFERMQEQGVDE